MGQMATGGSKDPPWLLLATSIENGWSIEIYSTVAITVRGRLPLVTTDLSILKLQETVLRWVVLAAREFHLPTLHFVLGAKISWGRGWNRTFSLTWPMSMFFNQNKRKRFHRNKIQFSQD